MFGLQHPLPTLCWSWLRFSTRHRIVQLLFAIILFCTPTVGCNLQPSAETDVSTHSFIIVSSSSTSAKTREAGDQLVLKIAGVEVAFRWIPAGQFQMGDNGKKALYHERPIHRVILTKGFWLAETETTQELWLAVMGENPSDFTGDGLRPVESVSWDDCNKFMDELNELTNANHLIGCFRLPTESEWEYACRAGTTGDYNVEGADLSTLGWYTANSEGLTHRVGEKLSNAWGLYDMHGNVWELCSDWYGDYPSGTVTDPTGHTDGSHRILRGGSIIEDARGCRSSRRFYDDASLRHCLVGFRLALTDIE